MTSSTPPLTALRAFAAFIRTGSISAAAEALSLTQGAIAHQIRVLESHVDVPLVLGDGRQLELTPQGRIYGYRVRNALDEIGEASQSVKWRRDAAPADQVVRVAVLGSFLQGWLLPRLDGFHRSFPNLRLLFDASTDYVELDAGLVDCAIRFGHGVWPGADVQPLMPDQLVLVAAPALLRAQAPMAWAQLMQLPLLHSDESWAMWMASMAEANQLPSPLKAQIAFTDCTHLVEAARLGMGIALTRRSVADNLLQRGELILASDHVSEHNSAYYTVLPASSVVSRPTAQFLGWLRIECARYAQKEKCQRLSLTVPSGKGVQHE
jgi:LysR family glycine cleavage system transcriptional activator